MLLFEVWDVVGWVFFLVSVLGGCILGCDDRGCELFFFWGVLGGIGFGVLELFGCVGVGGWLFGVCKGWVVLLFVVVFCVFFGIGLMCCLLL